MSEALHLQSSMMRVKQRVTVAKYLFVIVVRGVNPGEVGGRDPPESGQGGRWDLRGRSCGGRELLYLIMYRKYVRKW